MTDADRSNAESRKSAGETHSGDAVSLWLTPPILVPLGFVLLILGFVLWKHF